MRDQSGSGSFVQASSGDKKKLAEKYSILYIIRIAFGFGPCCLQDLKILTRALNSFATEVTEDTEKS